MPGIVAQISLSFLLLAVITTCSFAQQSADETAVRAFVQQCFALYAKNDLEGVLQLWSEKAPTYPTKRATLERQFAAQTMAIKIVDVSHLEIERERASLRATLDVTITSKQNGQVQPERQTNKLQLIREAGTWKIWEIVPAANELAVALERATSEQEQEQLLAQEKELVDSSLVAALKELRDRHLPKGNYAQVLRLSQLVIRVAEKREDRKELGMALSDLGAVYMLQNRTAEALDSLQKSAAIFEETNDKRRLAHVLNNVGLAHRLQSSPDQALEYFHRSLVFSSEDKRLTALIYNNIGIVHRMRGRYDLALDFYQKSRVLNEELKDKAALKTLLNSIGNVYQAQGHYERALEFYQQSRTLCEELGERVSLGVALYNIGTVYNFQGRYAEALTYFQKSLKISEKMGSAAKRDMAFTLHSLGMLYHRQGRYEQSLDYYHKSLKLREETQDRFGAAQTMNNIGGVYKSQGLDNQALEWLQKSLKLDEELKNTAGMAAVLNNIGDLHRRQGRYDLALEHQEKSLRLREEMGERRGIVTSLNTLSLLHQDKRNYAEMLESSRRAAQLALEINAPEELASAQEDVGIALRALGRPAEARQSFLAAIATIEAMRHHVAGSEQQQQSFLENKLSPWLEMIDLLAVQKEDAEALAFAERAKARVLLESLQTGRANIQHSLSPQERTEEEQHRLRLVALNTQLTREALSPKPDAARVVQLKAQIAQARLDFEALETRLYVAHPELKTKRGELKPITVSEATALLNEQTALLEFAVGKDKTHLFVITKAKAVTEFKTYSLPLNRKDLAGQTERFRKYLAEKDLRYSQSARVLYDLLLKPAAVQLQGKARLVIVPDGPLWELPFQALLRADNRFLLEDYTISLAPSFTFLREVMRLREQRKQHTQPATLLAVGNPALGNEMLASRAELMGDKLEPLPFAEQQAVQLGQLYKTKAKVFIGVAATEERLKAEAGNHRILHLATHGVLDDGNPMYSHLVFAQTGTNDKEDGLLEAREILELNLQADLAVLSACETGRGRISAGEGVIGLTWALFVAGVPSTVVSQWKVADKSTAELMLGFHKHLQAQNGKGEKLPTYAEALRLAALGLMKQPAYRHPFHWAGFVLIGDGF